MTGIGQKYLILGLAMAAIFGGVFAITTSATSSSTVTSFESMPYLIGHVTMEVADSDGNLKAYVQTDNLITDSGIECAMHRLLDATNPLVHQQLPSPS